MNFLSAMKKLAKNELINKQRMTVCLNAKDMRDLFKGKPDYAFECIPVTLKITHTAKQPSKAYFVVDAKAVKGEKDYE